MAINATLGTSRRSELLSTLRHVIAAVLMAIMMIVLGGAALLQGHTASERIVKRGQENFSSFRTASSEAGR